MNHSYHVRATYKSTTVLFEVAGTCLADAVGMAHDAANKLFSRAGMVPANVIDPKMSITITPHEKEWIL